MAMPQKRMELNPKRYWLREEDCERMTRNEIIAMKWLLAMLSTAKESAESLKGRLKSIPSGQQRMNMTMGGFNALATDLIGTITRAQAQLLQGTMNDYEVRLMPKLTPSRDAVVWSWCRSGRRRPSAPYRSRSPCTWFGCCSSRGSR